MCLQICAEAAVLRCVTILGFWLSVLLERAQGAEAALAPFQVVLSNLAEARVELAPLSWLPQQPPRILLLNEFNQLLLQQLETSF